MEYILEGVRPPAEEAPKVESTPDVELEIPAGWDPSNYAPDAAALRIEQLKRETELKRGRALGHPAIRKSEVAEPAPKDEGEERALIRRLMEVVKVRTQMGLLNPEQCLGCTQLHKFGVKQVVVCSCVCHSARHWLKEHKDGKAA